MRTLHVIPSLDPDTGGPARSVPALCRALQALGVQVTLFTFRRPRAAGAELGVDDLDVRWFVPLAGSRQLPTPSFYAHVRRASRSVDLVHLHSLWNPAISTAALAARRAGRPYLISPRGMLQAGAVKRRTALKAAYYRLVEHATLDGAAAIHFLTESEAADSRGLARSARRCFVVPSGIDPGIARLATEGRFRARWPHVADRQVVLFLGRLHWSKRLELHVEALRLLAAEFPRLVWVLAGPDAGEWHRLSQQARALGVADRLVWTGLLTRQQSLDALVDADVFVLTSRHEAHSAAMNEALAVGVPVVLTDSVGYNAVADAGAGLVVPDTPHEVANAVAMILREPALGTRMRSAGQRLVAERLAWPHVARAMVDAYSAILATDR